MNDFPNYALLLHYARAEFNACKTLTYWIEQNKQIIAPIHSLLCFFIVSSSFVAALIYACRSVWMHRESGATSSDAFFSIRFDLISII